MFVRTVRQDGLDHLTEKAFGHHVPAMPANPASTPKIGNAPSQYGWRLPMYLLMDARTVARVHRFEVIQEDPQTPWYIVERTFPEGLQVPVAAHGAELCRTLTQRSAEQDVTWVHSYVSDNKRRTFCVYDAPSPNEIRKAGGRNNLPAGRVTRVQVLYPYFYM